MGCTGGAIEPGVQMGSSRAIEPALRMGCTGGAIEPGVQMGSSRAIEPVLRMGSSLVIELGVYM